MKEEEIDQIIADSLAKEKGQSRWHRPKKRRAGVENARAVLNAVFMVGFLAAILIYFLGPKDDRTLFFCVGFGALAVKIAEFVLRFLF